MSRLTALSFASALPTCGMSGRASCARSTALCSKLVIRLPMVPAWAGDVEAELAWLPRLAGRLPLAVPTPVGRGEPVDGYPLTWSVYEWLDGEPASMDRLADPRQTGRDLAVFVHALRGLELNGGVRDSIAAAERLGLIDAQTVTAAWELVLSVPVWDGPPVLMHTDLLPANLLTVDGRLSAVIDFGGIGVGDPAADTIAAWTYMIEQVLTDLELTAPSDRVG